MTMQSDRVETDRETYQFAGGVMTVLADGARTGGRYTLLLARTPSDNTTPPHFHDNDAETVVMLDGIMTAETASHSQALYPREVAILPPGEVHRLSNTTEKEAAYLLLCVPAGFEDFVRQAGTRVQSEAAAPKPMDEDDVRRMVENAPAYGIRLTDGAELAMPKSQDGPVAARETFVAFGTTIEVLARFDDDADAPVLIRATAVPKATSPFTQRTPPETREVQFFAGLSGGSSSGAVAYQSVPALLAVTDRQVLRLLRQDCMAEPINAEGGPLERLRLALDSLHMQMGAELTERSVLVAPGLSS